MRRTILHIFILLFLSQGSLLCQEKNPKWDVNGYFKFLHSVWIPEKGDTIFSHDRWITNNQIYNRLNIHWYPTNSLQAYVGVRSFFVYGQFVQVTQPFYTDMLEKDNGYLDLTKVIAKDKSFILYGNIDRAHLQFTRGNFEACIGRQRVNWGTALVWNPNDIFNTFSYFDFDYEERPGSDAIKLEYYTGMTSSVQLAGSIDSAENMTVAGMYRFNRWNYDFQFLGGMMPDDYMIGAGWAGQIEGAGFRGEMSWFYPKDNFSDTSGIFVASIDADYTFKNSLYLHAAILYNSNGTTGKAGGYNMFSIRNLSVKQLSLARYSLLGHLSYPVTPLVQADVACIFNPSDKSFFVSPSVNVSLTNNIYVLLTGQLFMGDDRTEFGDYGQFWFLRLKWSF